MASVLVLFTNKVGNSVSSNSSMKKTKSEKDRRSDKHKKKKKHRKRKYSISHGSDSDSCKVESKEMSSKWNASEEKKKNKHKSKRYSSSSSSESASDGQVEWVEAPTPESESSEKKPSSHYDKQPDDFEASIADENNKQREEWMNEESFVPTLSKSELLFGSSRQKKIETEREKREKEEKIHKDRELNPYLKNKKIEFPDKEPTAKSLSLSSSSVGDGGYSWLKKAYYRILEQSQREGRSMEDIAVERWGSLDKLLSMIDEAEAKMKSNSKTHHRQQRWRKLVDDRDDRKESRSTETFFKPADDEFRSHYGHETSFKFKKPSDNIKSKKQFHHFSSAGSSKTSKVFPDDIIQHKDSFHSFTPHSSELKRISNSEREKKSSSLGRSDRLPAWKKPRPVSEIREKMEEDCSGSDIKPCNEDNFQKCDETLEITEHTSKDDSKMVVQTEEDLSKLAAKCIKAEIMGDMTLAQKLQTELDEARKFVQGGHSLRKVSKQQEEIILTKLDSSGQAHPIQVNQENRLSGGYSKHKSSKSNKYFDDDSQYSLKQMFEREKLTTADDNIEMFLDVASECNEVTDMDYEKMDIKKISQKMSHSRQEEKDIGKAIRQHQRRNAALEKCTYCLDQPNMKRYLLVDIREQVYLCLPNYQSLVENHCLIVPKQHVSSFLQLDEDEWREVEELKKYIRIMFKEHHKSVIFLETSMNFRYCPHAVLECLPIPEDSGDMAPFYFKKAIQESETEWAHNKKLVDLRSKGLRHSVPKNLPYFFVEFDPEVHAGYAHVIEDEKYFPRNFGKEIIGGMLDIDYNHLYKNRKEDPLKKSTEVLKFEQMWNKFKSEFDGASSC